MWESAGRDQEGSQGWRNLAATDAAQTKIKGGADDEDSELRRAVSFFPKGRRLSRCCGSIPVCFRDADKEQQYRQQKKQRLRKIMCRICFVSLVAHIFVVLTDLPTVDFENLTNGAQLYVGSLTIVAITSTVGMVCNMLPEVLVPWLFFAASFGLMVSNRSRAAFLAGESIEVAFANIATISDLAYCALLSDSNLVGNLACLIVVYYVVLPVRAIAGAWLTVGIPVLYLVFTVPKSEKDGGLARTLGVAIRLLICCLVGLVGRCYIEMGERSALLRVRKVEEDLTQEKVLRFAAEHENAKGPFSYKAEAEDSGEPQQPNTAAERENRSLVVPINDAASAVASMASRPLSSIIFTPSESREVPVELQLSAIKAVAAEEKWLISWSDVTFQSNLLGKGGYAMVVQGQYAGARVAVKMPSKEQLSTSKEVSDFFGKELRVLRHLRHPFIVNFYGACIEDTKQLVVLIEEYIDGSSLHDMILFQKDRRFTEQVRWQTLSSVGHALMYLHDQGPAILHGDLSAKNIMMRADRLEPVLIDFGMAVLHKSRQKLQGGSPRWMAPELISSLSQGGLAPDCSVDVFAFGRVCFFVATGQLPLQEYTVDELMAASEQGQLPPMKWPVRGHSLEDSSLIAFCKEELCPLCVATSPTDRCSSAQAVNLLQLQRPEPKFDALSAVEFALAAGSPEGMPVKNERNTPGTNSEDHAQQASGNGGGTYHLQIEEAAFTDAVTVGELQKNLLAESGFHFSVHPDTDGPVLAESEPANNSGDIDPATESVLLIFDEPVKDVDSDFGVRSAVVPRFGARPRLEMPRGAVDVNPEVGFAPLIFDFDVEAGSGFFQIYIWHTEISGENVTVEAVFIKEVPVEEVFFVRNMVMLDPFPLPLAEGATFWVAANQTAVVGSNGVLIAEDFNTVSEAVWQVFLMPISWRKEFCSSLLELSFLGLGLWAMGLELLGNYGSVLVTIAVLLAVEAASRSGNVQLSAVAASLPTGVPLALFLVACKPETSQATLAEFSESVVRGAAGTLAFAVAMVLVVRAGFGMVAMLVCGYAAWFVTWCSLSFLMAPHAGKAE
ncbi:putative serine/threonine-protein kinase/receptor [Symbiodinium microadriaticum]|uniref:Putative serine/threonine-protein kinase/receptor n=1 Tax=Symbiodinium microadriaticum TaxID=2951 RepID=A0A1Q9DRL5_SYMMI|nr:putative serine/threonine-protein kinase/receptor [Symbiodinium microadriaticum]